MFKVCKTDAQKKLIKLKKNRLYPGSWINMINPSNEELEKIAGWYESELSEKVRRLSSILEPVMVVIVGAAVGVMAVAVFMPVVSAINSFI